MRDLSSTSLENYGNAQWFRDGRRILVGGNERSRKARYFVQDFRGGVPRAVTPEGTHDGKISPDGKLVLALAPEGTYFLYPIDGGPGRSVPWLTEAGVVIEWSADSRSWFAYRGSDIPCRVERVSVEDGHRQPFQEIAPANRTGLLAVRPSFITDDEKAYAYTTYQQVSTLFVTEPGEGS